MLRLETKVRLETMTSRFETHEIGRRGAQTLYYAAETAEKIGLPLNTWVTINFKETKADPKDATKIFAKIRQRFQKWATRSSKKRPKTFETAWAFAFENAANGKHFETLNQNDNHNIHVHWAVHIPASRRHEFENYFFDLVDKVSGGIINEKTAVKFDDTFRNQNLSYLNKGTKKQFIKTYGRGRKAEPQGIILGRRSDVSRNIGPKVRRALDKKHKIVRHIPLSDFYTPKGQQNLPI